MIAPVVKIDSYLTTIDHKKTSTVHIYMLIMHMYVYIYIYIKWTVFVNLTTKSVWEKFRSGNLQSFHQFNMKNDSIILNFDFYNSYIILAIQV